MIKIKPVSGMRVKHPVTKILIPEAGMMVQPHDPYWKRRLKAGEVVICTPVASKPVRKKKTKKVSEE